MNYLLVGEIITLEKRIGLKRKSFQSSIGRITRREWVAARVLSRCVGGRALVGGRVLTMWPADRLVREQYDIELNTICVPRPPPLPPLCASNFVSFSCQLQRGRGLPRLPYFQETCQTFILFIASWLGVPPLTSSQLKPHQLPSSFFLGKFFPICIFKFTKHC